MRRICPELVMAFVMPHKFCKSSVPLLVRTLAFALVAAFFDLIIFDFILANGHRCSRSKALVLLLALRILNPHLARHCLAFLPVPLV
eukprot:14824_5